MKIPYSENDQKQMMENAIYILRKKFNREETLALIKAMALMSNVKLSDPSIFFENR